MIKKKHILLGVILIVFVILIAIVFLNKTSLKAASFIFKEQKQLNTLVKLFKDNRNSDIAELDIFLGQKENFVDARKNDSGEVEVNKDTYKDAFQILKGFKAEYGQYDLDFDSIHVKFQGDKMLIKMTFSAQQDKSFDEKYFDYELIYIDDGYKLPEYYKEVHINMINNNWGYYYKYSFMG